MILTVLERRIRRINDRWQAAKAAGLAEAYIRRSRNLSAAYIREREAMEGGLR